jgi:hypothetical protein
LNIGPVIPSGIKSLPAVISTKGCNTYLDVGLVFVVF